MAERQQVNRWIWAALAGAAGLVITALTVTTVTINASGSIHFEGDGDVDMDAEGIVKAAGTEDYTVSIGGDSIIRLASPGSSVTVGTGVQIAVTSAGDDLSISTAGGDDLTMTVADDYTATGDVFSTTAVTSATTAVTSGGSMAVAAGGVTLAASSAGDDITLTTSGGDDLLITLTDDYVASGDNFGTTADVITFSAGTSTTTSTTSGGSLVVNAGGITGTAATAGDDISLTAADDVTVTATAGPLLLLGASGQLQVDSNGLTVNGPVTSALAIGGSAYFQGPSLDFDYLNNWPSGTTEEVLATQTLPANTLSQDGRGIEVEAAGYSNANTNTKSVRVRIGASASGTGGTSVANCNFNTAADIRWLFKATIYRVASGTEKSSWTCYGSDGSTTTGIRHMSGSGNGNAASVSTSDIIDLNFTVENTTTNNDLIVNYVRWTAF